MPSIRRHHGSRHALLRLRADAQRVHRELDRLRDTVHESAPAVARTGASLRAVGRSLAGTGGDLAELARCFRRDLRGLLPRRR